MKLEKFRTVALALFAVLVFVPRQGGAEAPPALELSLADAMQRAAAQSPEVSMADRVVREREAHRVGAGIVMPVNPRLSIDARPLLHRGFARDVGYGAMLDFLFEVGGAPRARVAEADRGVALARSDREIERLHGRMRAWNAYLEAQIAELRISEARAAKVIAQRVLEAARRRADVGAGADIEVTTAELAWRELEAAETSFAREREARLMHLRDALDLPAGAAVRLTTPVEDPPKLGGVEAYMGRALERHPELAAIHARLDLFDAVEDRLERELVPRVGVYTGVDAAPLSPLYGVIGVSIELPFAQRNQGQRTVVGRARETERWRLELEARRIARDVATAYQSYEARRAELEILTESAIPAAERSLLLTETAWKAGRFDLFRVTAVERDLLRVRTTRVDVLEEAWRERIALERAAGGGVS